MSDFSAGVNSKMKDGWTASRIVTQKVKGKFWKEGMEINVVQICRKLICLQRYGVDLGNNCFRNLLISKNSLYLLTLHNSVTILNVKEVKKKWTLACSPFSNMI